MKHVLLLLALVCCQVNAASSVMVLDAQMQSDCYFKLTTQGAKPSQAHKFCRSIYGK